MYLFSLAIEDTQIVPQVFSHMSFTGWSCLLFTACISTWVGATGWGILVRTYSPSLVAPYSLLIPVFGLTFSHLILGKQLTPLIYSACGLIFLGLAINQWRFKKANVSNTTPKSFQESMDQAA